MRRNKLRLYLHLVWGTWDRLPFITPEIEPPLYRCIQQEVKDQKCKVLALNGTADHVHLLVSFPTTITIARLVKQVKGVSSRFVNDQLSPPTYFKWQGFYGAFTVSRWDVDKIKPYINHQKDRHAVDDVWPEWEEMYEEMDLADEGE